MTSLEDVLISLPAPDLKTVAKSLRLASGQVREVSIAAILRHVNQGSIGSFFTARSPSGLPASGALYNTVLHR